MRAFTLDQRLDRAHGAEYAKQLLGATGHARVTPEQLSRIETEFDTATEEQVLNLFPRDRMLTNFLLSIWEWAHGAVTLKSLPWNISLPISDVCNARCTFCTSWLTGRKQIALEELDLFEPVLKTAIYVGLVGHGEPLSHPELGEITARLSDYLDERAASYTITNGYYLDKWEGSLDRMRLSSISCSLNAATPETHQEVMGLAPKEFSRIVASLRRITSGEAASRPISVSTTLVVTKQNIHEIPAFIELSNEINAASVYLRTLLPQAFLAKGLNYHLLPAYFHPRLEELRTAAINAMKASPIPVYGEPETWSNPTFPEPLAREISQNPPPIISRADALRDTNRGERAANAYRHEGVLRGAPNPHPNFADRLKDETNPLGRQPPFRCRAVYYNLYVNELFLRVTPCCYMTRTPGHDEVRLPGMRSVTEAWNTDAFKTLRQRLAEGPLYGACERCPATW